MMEVENSITKMEKDIHEKIDKMNESDLIIKDAVIGFLVLKEVTRDGAFTSVQPIICDWEVCGDNYKCGTNEKIIGILPAAPETYRVMGLFPDEGHYDDYPTGSYKEIGYEFKGANHPDWIQEIKDRISYAIDFRSQENKRKSDNHNAERCT